MKVVSEQFMDYQQTNNKQQTTNNEAAQVFLRIAELMAYRDENQFKVRSYLRAALTLTGLKTPLRDLAEREELQSLPGVGDAIAGKIGEILQTGTCALYERLKDETSLEVQQMLRVPGLTPRLVRLLELEFNLTDMDALSAFISKGELSDLEGTTLKVEDAAQILRAVEAQGVFDMDAASLSTPDTIDGEAAQNDDEQEDATDEIDPFADDTI